MRVTLTIDDDVAAGLKRLRKAHNGSFEDLINEALQRGLKEMSARPKRREPFRTRAVDLGPARISSLDNVNEVLAEFDDLLVPPTGPSRTSGA
jgi:hypothetical protein